MKTNLQSWRKAILVVGAIALAGWRVFGAGGDYPNDQPANQLSWPDGMKSLVNTTNRIGGLWVNPEDLFFFSGTATNFSTFLAAYSKVDPIESHRLVLHAGAGEAFSLGGGNRRPCDWELDGCPKSWHEIVKLTASSPIEAFKKASSEPGYILEVDFWMGGKIRWPQVVVPRNIEFAGDCLKNFESITNGMTRAEVEGKLKMDGGLQSPSPVRFVDPDCPGFKVNVEFDYKRDAADQGRAIESKDDKVIHVSKLYLERPFMD